MSLKLAGNEEQAAQLGEAMRNPAFSILVALLEQYEIRILTGGIDDPEVSKDFMRGFVHAVRALRSDLQSARDYVLGLDRVEALKKEREANPPSPFMRPGRGAGGIS